MPLITCLLVFASGGGSPDHLKAEVFQDFRTHDFSTPVLRLVGPEANRLSGRDGGGLRVVLPGRKAQGSVGVATGFPVRGDFEVTGSFELLRVEKPTAGFGAGVSLYALADSDAKDAVSLARRVLKDGKEVFVADRMSRAAGKEDHSLQSVPAASRSGKLRLSRKGTKLSYWVAEGQPGEFKLIHEAEFIANDICLIQFSVNPGGSEAPLDARLGSLRVRAESLPNAPPGGRKPWGGWLLAAGGASLLAVAGLTAWAIRRRARG